MEMVKEREILKVILKEFGAKNKNQLERDLLGAYRLGYAPHKKIAKIVEPLGYRVLHYCRTDGQYDYAPENTVLIVEMLDEDGFIEEIHFEIGENGYLPEE